MRNQAREFWRQWLKPFCIVAAILAPLRSVVADWNDVPSCSMLPTIQIGDRILVNKLAYDLKVPFTTTRLATWSAPQRGDVIVFYSPADGKRLVKRAVAVPGDVIELRNNHLIINNEPATYESSGPTETVSGKAHPLMLDPRRPSMRSFGPVQLPPGNYFAMGDNRDNSFDSRYFGFVSRDQIVGRATMVAMSFDREHYFLPRFERFGQSLQ